MREVILVIFGSGVAVIGTNGRARTAYATASVLEAAGYPVWCRVLPPDREAEAQAVSGAVRDLVDQRCDVLLTLTPPPLALDALRTATRAPGLTGWVQADEVGTGEAPLLLAAAGAAGVRYAYAPVPLDAGPTDPASTWHPVLLALGPHVARRRA